MFSVDVSLKDVKTVRVTSPAPIFAREYNTNDEDSDEYSMAITQFTHLSYRLGNVDDVTECMMLESPRLGDFVGLGSIRCHLKSQTKYPATRDDPDNVLFLSWRLHQRFDGLRVQGPKSIPQFALRFVQATKETRTFSDGVERTKVHIDLDFPPSASDSTFSEEVFSAVHPTMKEGSVADRAARKIHTFVWVQKAHNFKKYVGFKYKETCALWNRGKDPGEAVEDENLAHRLRVEATRSAEEQERSEGAL